MGNEIVDLGYDEELEVSKLVDTAESKLSGIRKDNSQHQHGVKEMAFKVMDSIAKGEKPKMISTGFESIDKYAKGMYGSQLIILGARPGVGKTCLGLSVAQRVASVGGTVAYFSLEMRASELTEDFSRLSHVCLTKIRNARYHQTKLRHSTRPSPPSTNATFNLLMTQLFLYWDWQVKFELWQRKTSSLLLLTTSS